MNNETKKTKNFSVILLVAGVAGIIITAVFLISSYRTSNSMQELMRPLICMFVPFVVSFALIKAGVNGLVNKKK